MPAIPDFGAVDRNAAKPTPGNATSMEDVVATLVAEIRSLKAAITENSSMAAIGQIRAEVRHAGGMPTTRGRIH